MKHIRKLEEAMYRHARDLEFEEAAKLRDDIARIKSQGFRGPGGGRPVNAARLPGCRTAISKLQELVLIRRHPSKGGMAPAGNLCMSGVSPRAFVWPLGPAVPRDAALVHLDAP